MADVVFKSGSFGIESIATFIPFRETEGSAPVRRGYDFYVFVEPFREWAKKPAETDDLTDGIDFQPLRDMVKEGAETLFQVPLDKVNEAWMLASMADALAEKALNNFPIKKIKVDIRREDEIVKPDDPFATVAATVQVANVFRRGLDRVGEPIHNLREKVRREEDRRPYEKARALREFEVTGIPITLPYTEREGGVAISQGYHLFVGVESRHIWGKNGTGPDNLRYAVGFKPFLDTVLQSAATALTEPMNRQNEAQLMPVVSDTIAEKTLGALPIKKIRVSIRQDEPRGLLNEAESDAKAANWIDRRVGQISARYYEYQERRQAPPENRRGNRAR